jgi:alanine transaminase
MVPVPQYPQYSASIEEFELGQVGYFLNESSDWALDTEELERSLEESKNTYAIKGIVVINPGNPTGQVLTRTNIEEVIKFAYKHRLFIFADEVRLWKYFLSGKLFRSIKKTSTRREPHSTVSRKS